MSRASDARSVVMVAGTQILVRMTIAEFLRDCGYQVIEGTVPDDLWSVIKSGNRLDVVLTEVRLTKDGDGFELAKRLRQNHPGIDVLLTSSVPDAADKAKTAAKTDRSVALIDQAEEVGANRIKLLIERAEGRRSPKRRQSDPPIHSTREASL